MNKPINLVLFNLNETQFYLFSTMMNTHKIQFATPHNLEL